MEEMGDVPIFLEHNNFEIVSISIRRSFINPRTGSEKMWQRVLIFGLFIAGMGITSSNCAGEDGNTVEMLAAKETGSICAGKEVEFLDGSTGLKGTLYMPDVEGLCPGVIIVGGAERGPRNEYKRQLAGYFAGWGMAALIYDSPGTGESTGMALMQTKNDRVKEAVAAHRFLRRQDRIDPGKTGIWGISEGAGVALLAAVEEEEVAFVIALSGAMGISPFEISAYRIEVKGLEMGLSLEEIQKGLVFAEIFWTILTGRDVVEWRLLEMKAKKWADEPWEELITLAKRSRQELEPEEKIELKDRLQQVMSRWKSENWFKIALVNGSAFERMKAMNAEMFFGYLKQGPWARGDWQHYWREINEIPKIKCPVLAIWGERDNFLPPNRSKAVFEYCMSKSRNNDVTTLKIRGANHIMKAAEGNDFTEQYLEVMREWVNGRLLDNKKKKGDVRK